jgi:O-antigen/teichoic acid export membrane protein
MTGTAEPKKNNYWIKSGILNLFQNFSGAMLGVFGMMMMIRLLTPAQLGVWGLFLSTGTILELVRSGLVQNAVIKFVSARPEDEAEVLSAALVISILLTISCIILILCFAGFLARLLNAAEMEALLYWYIPMFLASGVLTQFCSIEQAHFSYKGVVACNFVRSFVFFAFLAICMLKNTPPSLMSLMYVQIAGVVLAVITSWFYVKQYLAFTFRFSREWVAKIFHYGKYGFGTSISSLLSGNIDQWMLGTIMNPASVAPFRVSVNIINLMDIPMNTIATIVFPQSARRMETDGKEAVRYLYERSVGAILAVVIPAVIFIYLFDKPLMTLFASKKYIMAVPILDVMLLYTIFIPYGRQFGAIMDSIGRTRTSFWLVVFTATFLLTLNFFFIKWHGALGAAYATLIANVVGFAIGQYILHKELKVNPIHPLIYAWHFYTEAYHNYLKKYFIRNKSAN